MNFRDKIWNARQIAQVPRMLQGEDWYSYFFTRYFTIYISVPIYELGVSANAVTVWMGIVCLIGSICIVFDSVWFVLLGGLLWQLWYILDCVDGEVARLSGKTSKLGSYIDLLTHIYVNPTIPLAFGLHMFFREQTTANAICAFLLYSIHIWKTSILKARGNFVREKIDSKPVQNDTLMPLGWFRFLIFLAFNIIGQMFIFPIVLIFGYLIDNRLSGLFLYIYTTFYLIYIIFVTSREIILVHKIDLEKSK
jgi:phosphatidylglycerophosphate synthase